MTTVEIRNASGKVVEENTDVDIESEDWARAVEGLRVVGWTWSVKQEEHDVVVVVSYSITVRVPVGASNAEVLEMAEREYADGEMGVLLDHTIDPEHEYPVGSVTIERLETGAQSITDALDLDDSYAGTHPEEVKPTDTL